MAFACKLTPSQLANMVLATVAHFNHVCMYVCMFFVTHREMGH